MGTAMDPIRFDALAAASGRAALEHGVAARTSRRNAADPAVDRRFTTAVARSEPKLL